LLEPKDVLDKMVYAYTNPTAADLVDTVEEWPGVSSFQAALTGGQLTATRPTFFFRSGDKESKDKLPDVVTLPIVRPRAFADHTQVEWSALLTEQVHGAEAHHRARREAAGKTVLGREAILAQDPFSCPQSAEPHFGISPRIACKSKWTRIEALQRCKDFLDSYARAIKAWMLGATEVVFPAGTYWMRRFARVVCEAVGDVQAVAAATLPAGAG
jgi:putative transposase